MKESYGGYYACRESAAADGGRCYPVEFGIKPISFRILAVAYGLCGAEFTTIQLHKLVSGCMVV